MRYLRGRFLNYSDNGYALLIVGLSLLTRKWHPNVGLMVLGSTALVLALLPFALPLKKPAP